MKRPDLPVYYYHDHFTEMLAFVSEVYGPMLQARHRAFIGTFKALSKDAQCLLIRMVNRRGRIFRPAAFRYNEISDATAALQELQRCGLVRGLTEQDYDAFILCHSRDTLIQAGKAAGFALRTTWAKAKLANYFLTSVTFATAYRYCDGDAFIALGDTEPVEFLLYLYFGKTQEDLKRFALRDLGIMRTHPNANVSARFTDEAEAHACFHYSRLLDRLESKTHAAIQ